MAPDDVVGIAPRHRRGDGTRDILLLLLLFVVVGIASSLHAQKRVGLKSLWTDAGTESRLVVPPAAPGFDGITHTSWTRRDGAPGGITALAQTKDGYLWIGSSLGLYRFDGLQFLPYPFSESSAPLPSLEVSSLSADPDGGLWIGMRKAAVVHLEADGRSILYGRNSGLTSDTLDEVIARPNGSIWAIAANKLWHLEKERWVDFGQSHGMAEGGVFSVFFDREGNIWVGQSDRMSVLKKSDTIFRHVPVSVKQVNAMAEDRTGQLWIADSWRSVRPLFNPSSGETVPIRGKAELLADESDNLWIAQNYYGLTRIKHFSQISDARQFESDDSAKALSSPETRALLEDREGNLWVGTAGGLDRFQKTSFVQFSPVPLNNYPALVAADDGSVWVNSDGVSLIRILDGTREAVGKPVNSGPLARMRGGGICFIDATAYELQCYGRGKPVFSAVSDALMHAPAVSMIEDQDGSLLVSFLGKGLWRFRGTWERVQARGLPPKAPWAMFFDTRKQLWLGYPNDHVVVRRGGTYQTFQVEGSVWSNTLTFHEAAGTIWAAGSNGLCFFDGHRLRAVHGARRTLLRGISGIAQDNARNLWLNGAVGVIRVSAEEIDHLLQNPDQAVKGDVFDDSDGLIGLPTQFKPTPSAIADQKGRLWFATAGHVAMMDPTELDARHPLPNVLIESALMDGTPLSTTSRGGATLVHESAAHLHNLQINYIGINLSAPERVFYRYRLTGEERKWQQVGTRRQAFYTRLSPGSYHFQVSASNGQGWSDLRVPLDIEVSPAFYQTWWFEAVSVVLGAGFLWLMYWLRLRQAMAQVRIRTEERANERLRIARELHDTLLQSIHGLMLRFHYATETIPANQPARAHLETALARADDVLIEGRQRVQALRVEAPVPADFAAELARIGRELRYDETVAFEVIELGERRVLQPLVQQELLTILREALANAFHHANASRIGLEVSYGHLNLEVRCTDNGVGMKHDIAAAGRTGHWGLAGMHERARTIGAHIVIWSAPGEGTQLNLRISSLRCYRGSRVIQETIHHLRDRLAKAP